MMTTLFDYLLDKTPWWLALGIMTVLSMVKWGPKIVKKWGETFREIRKNGVQSEYIADLRMQRDRLQKEVDELKKKAR